MPEYVVLHPSGHVICRTYHSLSAIDIANGLSRLEQYRDHEFIVRRDDGVFSTIVCRVMNGQIVTPKPTNETGHF